MVSPNIASTRMYPFGAIPTVKPSDQSPGRSSLRAAAHGGQKLTRRHLHRQGPQDRLQVGLSVSGSRPVCRGAGQLASGLSWSTPLLTQRSTATTMHRYRTTKSGATTIAIVLAPSKAAPPAQTMIARTANPQRSRDVNFDTVRSSMSVNITRCDANRKAPDCRVPLWARSARDGRLLSCGRHRHGGKLAGGPWRAR
jgi:hypothetical protein